MKTISTYGAVLILLIALIRSGSASNLANPLTPLPPARIGIGLSYSLGGHTITNREIPALLNRIHCRATYSPVSLINFGFDLGATQLEVASDTTTRDTLGIFHGEYRFSVGGHLKLSTPLYRDLVGAVAIAQTTRFSSSNEHDARYEGIDGDAALGVLFHIPGIGYAALGPKVYLIRGKNRGYDGAEGKFANVNNVRAWLAVDYFPRVGTIMENRPYFSFEMSLSPEVAFRKRAPVQEFEFSITFGTVTPRLYGEVSEAPWEP
ncbi:MAG: hypothetical protein GF344_08830 [Chitinivibrionales bacterium]|nr:hypothetical protein [Chitinivibrionales bacterium]MBD3356962.1 hypothetical protein [Chitinivibrionales bacterium]